MTTTSIFTFGPEIFALVVFADLFPIRHLDQCLFTAFNPNTTGSGFIWSRLAVLGAWTVGGTLAELRRRREKYAPSSPGTLVGRPLHLSSVIYMTEATSTPATSSTPATASNCCGTGLPALDAAQAGLLADRVAALADPVRLQILSLISAAPSGEVCACDFVGPIDRSQPTISHHLKVLAEHGIIDGDKRGRWVWYRLAADGVDTVVSSLRSVVQGT